MYNFILKYKDSNDKLILIQIEADTSVNAKAKVTAIDSTLVFIGIAGIQEIKEIPEPEDEEQENEPTEPTEPAEEQEEEINE